MRYRKPAEQCRNLYRFIRLVLGEAISDREIARRWGIDEKNLRELKRGVRVVPKLGRLEELAEVLGVHRLYVLEAAAGNPAHRVHALLASGVLEPDLRGMESLLEGRPGPAVEKQWALRGLQAAALAAAETLEPDEIYPRASRELKRYGFESHFFLFDHDAGNAFIRHSSFHPRLLRSAERTTGLALSSFRFPVERVPPFKRLQGSNGALYLPDATVLLRQILGEGTLQRFIEKMRGMFRILEAVLTPLTVRGRVHGVLATGLGGRLEEGDVTEMSRFSQHLSVSLENALSFQQLRHSATRLRTLFDRLPAGVFEADAGGRITQINPCGADLLGFECADGSVGADLRALGLVGPEAGSGRTRTDPPGVVKSRVGTALRRDGRPFQVDVTYRTEVDRRGNVLRTEGIFRPARPGSA